MPEVKVNQVGALLGIHAQTPLHPGAGTALGAVDLPVQRERHTHWPNIAGSALKGILRDACRERISQQQDLQTHSTVKGKSDYKSDRERADNTLNLTTLFGPPTGDSSEFAGALSVTDARILAFPVRSLRGVFAWVSCPGVLTRLQRDAALAGLTFDYPEPPLKNNEAKIAMLIKDCPCQVDGRLVLEEFEFTPHPKLLDEKMLDWLVNNLLPNTTAYKATRERFKKQFVLISDDDFTHYVRHATEVCARVGLNYESKTVRDGALFYQEFLPTETIFYSVVLCNPSRAKDAQKPASELMQQLRGYLPPMLQIGGDETTGKGFCAVQLSGGSK